MKIRTTKPEKGNKYYITKSKGGYSNAIIGKPTDPDCNTLSNCVGYAYGRFNEIGNYGYCKYLAPVNAENFIKYKGSCEVGQTPKVGACMVWAKGEVGNPDDGAGHVEIVENINNDGSLLTSGSNYNGKAFYNNTRSKGDGNWGLKSPYKFLGFIYNPAVKEDPKPELQPQPKPEPQPTTTLKVGDKVKIQIKSKGYSASSDGKARGGKLYKAANGWTRTIIAIHKGKPYPYQVGLGHITTGFFKEEDLKKI